MGNSFGWLDVFNITGMDQKRKPLSLPGSNGGPESQAKNAAQAAEQQNAATIAAFKDSQATASTNAQTAVRRRAKAASQTVFTSPLGLSTQADVSRKTLLGQ